MADEDPWGTGEDDTTVQETPAVTVGNDLAAAPTVAAGDAPAGEGLPEAEGQAQEDPNFRRPLTLYKHWVRLVVRKNYKKISCYNLLFFAGRNFCNINICTIIEQIIMMMSLIIWTNVLVDLIERLLVPKHGLNVYLGHIQSIIIQKLIYSIQFNVSFYLFTYTNQFSSQFRHKK